MKDLMRMKSQHAMVIERSQKDLEQSQQKLQIESLAKDKALREIELLEDTQKANLAQIAGKIFINHCYILNASPACLCV